MRIPIIHAQPLPQPIRIPPATSLMQSIISLIKKIIFLVILYFVFCNVLHLVLKINPKGGYQPKCYQKYYPVCKTLCYLICRNPDPVIPQKLKTQNGLILIGDQKDINVAKTYIDGEYLEFIYDKWRVSDDNDIQLETFIKNTVNFRVVVLISENKLRDHRSLYIRKLLQQLSHIQGIDNYLSYIDILVIQRTFDVLIAENLKALAITKQKFVFKKTTHLLANLLFNLKNHSITERQFFKDIQFKKGLNSNYLILDESQLNIKTEMQKQAYQLLKNLQIKLSHKSQKKSQMLMSLYYSVENKQKDQVLDFMSNILDDRVLIHLADPDIEVIYGSKIKQIIESLKLKVNQNNGKLCVPPEFNRDKCEKQFYLSKTRNTKERIDNQQ